MDNEGWFLIEEIPNSYVFLLSGTFRRLTEEFKINYGLDMHMNLLYKNNALYLYFIRKEFLDAGAKFFSKGVKNPEFLKKVNRNNQQMQQDMFRFSRTLAKKNLSILDDDELIKLYLEFANIFEKAIVAGWVDNAIEFEREMFSRYLQEYISRQALKNKLNLSSSQIFSILSTPDRMTYGKKQETALKKIALKIKKDRKLIDLFRLNKVDEEVLKEDFPAIYKAILKHTADFCWYFHMYQGPAWNVKEFIDALAYIVCSESQNSLEKEKRNKEKLLKPLKADAKHKKLLRLASEMVFNKDLRKHSIYYSCYASTGLFAEIAARKGISLLNARNILPWEMKNIFSNKNIKQILRERETGFLMEFFNGNTVLKNANEANEFIKSVMRAENIEKESTSVNSIKGSCAYPGTAKGYVRIVNVPSDMAKLNEGDILVSHQTNPDLLPAMKRATAFVTDIGGITCHAAVVSREMKKPCIVGTKIGTKILKDGDRVEIDAEKGIVRKI